MQLGKTQPQEASAHNVEYPQLHYIPVSPGLQTPTQTLLVLWGKDG